MKISEIEQTITIEVTIAEAQILYNLLHGVAGDGKGRSLIDTMSVEFSKLLVAPDNPFDTSPTLKV